MSAVEELAAVQSQRRNGSDPLRSTYRVEFDEKGKLTLPAVPERSDHAGLCAWLTAVFSLEPAHPIIGGRREGLHGPEGHVALTRAGAASIRFGPATRINSPAKLIETLSWQMLDTDGAVHALKGEHCRSIAHVVRMLCGVSETITAAEEAEAIVGTFMQSAEPVEGHTTYGTSGQRYEAAVALRRALDGTGRSIGPARYLIDANTGEMVIAVSDLQDGARRHIGSSIPHGWLDARMETAGWRRVDIDGHELPGRAGRRGAHARVHAYRGLLTAAPEDDDDANTEAVTT
jgi:hypothetical protein